MDAQACANVINCELLHVQLTGCHVTCLCRAISIALLFLYYTLDYTIMVGFHLCTNHVYTYTKLGEHALLYIIMIRSNLYMRDQSSDLI